MKMRLGLMGWLIMIVVPCFGTLVQAPDLGSASSFGFLSGGAISNTGLSVVDGDVGAVVTDTGFYGGGPGTVTPGHTMYAPGNGTVVQAVADFHSAIFAPAGAFYETPTLTLPLSTGSITTPTTFDGNNVYFLQNTLNGTGDINIASPDLLIFDAQGDSAAMFIIQVTRDLTVGGAGSPILLGGALAQNIFWTIGRDAALSTPMTWDGDLFVQRSFTMSLGGTVHGCVFTDDAGGTNTLAAATFIGGCEDTTGVPEPGTVALLGAGLFGLVLLGRTYRKRAA
jgi:hypothetical protein